MEDTIKIKCPYCAAVLTVRYIEGIESKRVTCPICKQKSPFTEFRQVADVAEGTQYPDSKGGGGAAVHVNSLTGILRVLPSGPVFQLHTGGNIVGRQASQSAADFQIATGESRRLSREHIVVDVRKVEGKGVVHTVSLCKEKCNPTFVGSAQLEYGDCVILHAGDVIKLPDVDVRFELPDDEGTTF